MSLNVFEYFFECRDGQNEGQRHSSGVATGRRNVWYLLDKCYEQEENVGVAVELLEQELGNEGCHVVLGGGDAVITELVPTVDVEKSHLRVLATTDSSGRVVAQPLHR